jgi:rpsU-divergently transcribed protein
MLALRATALKSALELVKVHGWSDRVLLQAVTDLSLSPVHLTQAAARGLFPNGSYELIEHLFDEWDSRLQQDINATAIQGLRQRDRVILCVRKRLEYEAPYRATWRQAMSLGADFDHITTTASRLWATWGLMLRLTGDESSGVSVIQINFYQNCACVGWAFTRAELTLLTDGSPGHEATWQHLQTLV